MWYRNLECLSIVVFRIITDLNEAFEWPRCPVVTVANRLCILITVFLILASPACKLHAVMKSAGNL